MIAPHVTIDDKAVHRMLKELPMRGKWAMSEGLKMAGGHFRKEMRDWIEKGGPGWKSLRQMTIELHKSGATSPLHFLGRLVRFKYSRAGGNQKIKIGFFNKGKGFKEGNRWVTLSQIAKRHELGRRKRVTAKMRRYWAWKGYPIRKTTKWIELPARPMIRSWFMANYRKIGPYIERRFMQKYFSRQKPKLIY